MVSSIDTMFVMVQYRGMKREKALRKINVILDRTFSDAWDNGNTAGYQDGFDDGVMEHKQMIRNRINMHIETCMNTNKFKEAQFAKEMLEYLMWEYDPEEAERKLREEEEASDGFGLLP